jgi:ribosome biogenesis protein Nip4
MLLSKRAVRLRFRPRRLKLRQLERRSSKNLRVKKREDALMLSTLKTYATSCTCKS